MSVAIRKRKGRVVPIFTHRRALAATQAYVERAIGLVQAYPPSVHAEAERLLNTCWLVYLLALQMSYGELPAKESEIARENLADVMFHVRKTLERQTSSRKDIAPQLRQLGIGDLKAAEVSARNLIGKLIMKSGNRRTISLPQVPGAAYLLLRTKPEVLLRRAVIAQLLNAHPTVTQKGFCERLDYYNCPVPGEWREALDDVEGAINWKFSFKSERLQNRAKKLLSDDVEELRKWGVI